MKWKALVASILLSASFSTHADCLHFPLSTGRFNLPLTEMFLQGKKQSFVIDLGMSQALSLEPTLFEEVTAKQKAQHQTSSDLNGKTQSYRQVVQPKLGINNVEFKDILIRENQPWGMVLSASTQVELPTNTIGLGLFAKGYLYYQRHLGQAKWCSTLPVIDAKHIDWYPLHVDEEGVHIAYQHGNHRFDLVIDTASTFSMMKPNHLKSRQCPKHANYQCVLLANENSSSQAKEYFYMVDMPKVFQSDGLLGDSFLQKHDLIVDREGQRVGLVAI